MEKTKLSEEYYNGPLVGYTTEEIVKLIGLSVLKVLDDNGLQLVWKQNETRL